MRHDMERLETLIVTHVVCTRVTFDRFFFFWGGEGVGVCVCVCVLSLIHI